MHQKLLTLLLLGMVPVICNYGCLIPTNKQCNPEGGVCNTDGHCICNMYYSGTHCESMDSSPVNVEEGQMSSGDLAAVIVSFVFVLHMLLVLVVMTIWYCADKNECLACLRSCKQAQTSCCVQVFETKKDSKRSSQHEDELQVIEEISREEESRNGGRIVVVEQQIPTFQNEQEQEASAVELVNQMKAQGQLGGIQIPHESGSVLNPFQKQQQEQLQEYAHRRNVQENIGISSQNVQSGMDAGEDAQLNETILEFSMGDLNDSEISQIYQLLSIQYNVTKADIQNQINDSINLVKNPFGNRGMKIWDGIYQINSDDKRLLYKDRGSSLIISQGMETTISQTIPLNQQDIIDKTCIVAGCWVTNTSSSTSSCTLTLVSKQKQGRQLECNKKPTGIVGEPGDFMPIVVTLNCTSNKHLISAIEVSVTAKEVAISDVFVRIMNIAR